MRGSRPGGRLMLNVAKLAAGGEDYYLHTIAHTVEDYYLGRGEAPGRWLGRGVEPLGLERSVSADDLRAVLGGRDPSTSKQLTSRPNRRVPGFDLCFRPPKSVSLLWALSDSDTSIAVRKAHDRAVDKTLAFIEDEVIRSRRGRNGVEQVEVTGLIGAAFRHRTSREQDPLLHTHVLVANCVQAVDDGAWRTLDSRRLYRWSRTAGFVYQAQLRHELTEALGVAWQPVTNGYADVAGVPRELIEVFSTRRAQIVSRLEERGESSARAAQVAALDTRHTKEHHVDPPGLVDVWRATAVEHGFDLTDLERAVGRKQTPEPIDVAAALSHMLSHDGLTANASTFDRRDVLRAWAQAHPDGASAKVLQRLADATLNHETGAVIDLDDPTGVLRRLAPAGLLDHRYSTPGLLATEQRLVSAAVARTDDGVGVVPAHVAVRVLRAARGLSSEQRGMIRRLITSGAGVEVVVGKAGSGKTTALTAAHEAWRKAGVPVVGCALSARAARELERGSGIRSSTIHRLLADLDRYGERAALAAGSVLVVDEAGMVGTRMLARLLDHARDVGAKVVLVGDHHQLPEIEAGGAFRALANRLDSFELTDNRRQVEDWERDALDQLRNGDPARAVAAYAGHSRITDAVDAEAVRHELIGDWWAAAVEHGLDAVMIAARNSDVADLNARARQRLVDDGTVGGGRLQAAGRTFQPGDRVVCLRNDHDNGAINGMRATITAVHAPARAVALRPDDDPDRMIVLRSDYLDAGHLDHGYAITAHKAQGLTCDATFVLADDTITREWTYVALSRGRQINRLYLADGHMLDNDDAMHAATLQPETGLDETTLPVKVRRSRKQHLAVNELDSNVRALADDIRRSFNEAGRGQQHERERGFGIGL